ncbi:MAG: ExeM/NucH family extracellular endonuclease [Candidatus Thiothrix sulfatifontis]|nr:MAG: ExeM/NucH family extracellular endonuclease [Candidatus Thiothrix sulfatifontis]
MNAKHLIYLSALGSLFVAKPALAELFFSEYLEGSSNNKAIEIYNPDSNPVDLSLYKIELYSNGNATSGSSMTLSGTLGSKATYVIANGSASTTIKGLANIINSGVTAFNGDDALVLKKNGTTVVDSFGKVGEDPGTAWISGSVSTLNMTLRRKSSITAGDVDSSNAFDPAAEWDGYAQDTSSGLGSHTVVSVPTGTPTANAGADQSGITAGATVTLDGSASSDPNGTIASYAWTQTAGTAVTLSASNVAQPTFDSTGISGALTFSLTVTDNEGNTSAADTVTITVAAPSTGACGTADKKISEVQGAGSASPLNNQVVTIQGVVTKVLPSLSGYMVQEEDGDQDGNSATSEGIFVFDSSYTPSVGDIVAVKGTVSEYFDLTELKTVTDYAVCGTGSVTPAAVSLPFTATSDLEKHEGMLVSFPQTLTVTETYWLARLGQVTLSSPGKQPSPTQVAEPGSAANTQATANDLARVILDDGIRDDSYTYQNPDPVQYPGFGVLTYDNPIRSGYTTSNLTGVVHYASNFLTTHQNIYRIIPTSNVSFAAANPRETTPPTVGGDIKVTGYNVLNYFTTLTSAGNVCGPAANVECRGADDAAEFDRQNTKLMNALKGINADIVGLIEIENNSSDTALQTLVNNLNTAIGAGTYAYISTGVIGTDAIKQALIYKPAKVEPVGNYSIVDYNDDKNRPSLIQTFKPVGGTSAQAFTVVVNHFKSKGSACDTDPDTGDGQGNCNLTRKTAVQTLMTQLASAPNQRILLLGDFNAYAKEDPIDVVKAAGYVDLASSHSSSYVFDGEWGTLDYAFASPSLAAKVAGSATWHINADEPVGFDYDMTFKKAAQDTSYYNASAFRSSDHDPVLVGLNLACSASSTVETSPTLAVANNKWTMFGLPLNPGANNQVQQIFDELNAVPYGSRWVVYEVDNTSQKYTKLAKTSTMTVGKAYWILTLNGAVNVTMQGISVSPDSQCRFDVPLHATGYSNGENAVGNPYAQAIEWSDILVKTGSVYRTPTNANTDNILYGTFIKGPSGTGTSGTGGYTYGGSQSSGLIQAWEAIWVKTKPGFVTGTALAMPSP